MSATHDAQRRLESMRAAYEMADAYEDSGRVWELYGSTARPRAVLGTFATSFLRPAGRFCFEFQSPKESDKFVIAVENWVVVEVRLPVPHRLSTLGAAIAGFTGVTFGTAHIVPRMLIPEFVGGRAVWQGHRASVIGARTVGGEVCDVITLDAGSSAAEVVVGTRTNRLRSERTPVASRTPNEPTGIARRRLRAQLVRYEHVSLR